MLLARNEEIERGMFERWKGLLLLMREKRVTPFPNFERKDNNDKVMQTSENQARLSFCNECSLSSPKAVNEATE